VSVSNGGIVLSSSVCFVFLSLFLFFYGVFGSVCWCSVVRFIMF